MGLDMYLVKKTYVKNWDHHLPENRFNVTVTKGGETHKHINPDRVNYVIEDVGYWRKANQIHNWFVHNVQGGQDDCREYYVDREDLEALLEACYQVKDNPESAPDVLPVSDGFFFGNTEYDEWYMNQIEDTINIIEPLLKELDEDSSADIFYQSSW